MKMDLILGQYELMVGFHGDGNLIADIRHWNHDEMTPVGNLYVSQEPGNDEAPAYSSIRLYLRSDVRYDAKTGETKAIVFPQSSLVYGSNKDLLFGMFHRKEADLPYYHPALPEEILSYLIENGFCSEPLRMELYHKTNAGIHKQVKTIKKP
jgi:hypothetical protein